MTMLSAMAEPETRRTHKNGCYCCGQSSGEELCPACERPWVQTTWKRIYITYVCMYMYLLYVYAYIICVLQMQMNVYYMCIPYVYALYVTCVYHMYICVFAFVCGYNFFMEGLRM